MRSQVCADTDIRLHTLMCNSLSHTHTHTHTAQNKRLSHEWPCSNVLKGFDLLFPLLSAACSVRDFSYHVYYYFLLSLKYQKLNCSLQHSSVFESKFKQDKAVMFEPSLSTFLLSWSRSRGRFVSVLVFGLSKSSCLFCPSCPALLAGLLAHRWGFSGVSQPSAHQDAQFLCLQVQVIFS